MKCLPYGRVTAVERESQRGDLDLIGEKWLGADFCSLVEWLTDFIVCLNFPAGDAWLR